VVLDRARTIHGIGGWPAHAVCWIMVTTIVIALGACVTRPGPEVLQPTRTEQGGRKITIFVATLRTPEPGSGTAFNSGQSQTLRFARYVISIPPTHQTDMIEWPSDPPDPASDFVTVDATRPRGFSGPPCRPPACFA
jgi:hypothetical protein